MLLEVQKLISISVLASVGIWSPEEVSLHSCNITHTTPELTVLRIKSVR